MKISRKIRSLWPPAWACDKKKNHMLSYESRFSRHMTNMDNTAKYFMFLKWKGKILVCSCIFYKKNFGVKNTGTILFTNNFDLDWKKNSLIKIDWDPMELSRKTLMISTKRRPLPRGGGRVLGLIFAGYVPLASQGSYPIIVYFVANCRPHITG